MALPGLGVSHIPYELKERVWGAYKHKLRPYGRQVDFLKSTATHRVLAGGNRSGKTEAVAVFEVPVYLLWPNTRGWWVTANYALGRAGWEKIRRVLVEELDHREVVRRGRMQHGEFYFSVRENTLHMWTGSTLAFKSADNADSLHAEALHYVVVDEAALIPYMLYDTRIIPRLADYGGWVASVGTFELDTGVWFEDAYYLGQTENPHGIQSFSLPTTENPYIDQAWLRQQYERLKSQGLEEVYKARYLGVPVPNLDRVYPTLSVVTHGDEAHCRFDSDLPVYLAVDPGGVYAVAVVQVKSVEGRGTTVCVIDELYYQRTVTTAEVIDECRRREWWENVGTGEIGGAIDVAAKEQKRAWALAGVPLVAQKVGVQAGIQALAGFINSNRFLFHPKCVNLNMEALRYRYPPGVFTEKDARARRPVDAYNHLLKALAYFVVAKFGVAGFDDEEVGADDEEIFWKPRLWGRYGTKGKVVV